MKNKRIKSLTELKSLVSRINGCDTVTFFGNLRNFLVEFIPVKQIIEDIEAFFAECVKMTQLYAKKNYEYDKINRLINLN